MPVNPRMGGCKFLQDPGSDTMPSVQICVDVRFAETDLMQVVHHAAYLPWLEMGRIAFMQAQETPYTEIARTHHFSVVSVSLQIRRSLTFGDTAVVTTTLAALGTRKIRFDYQVHNAAAHLLIATGSTEHVCVDLQGRSARIPQDIATRLRGTPSATG